MDTRLIASIAILAAVNIWISWRYAFQPIGPDEGIWLLWGFTGAKYGKDFTDCKPPGIHLWMLFLSWITRRNLWLVKFIHHMTVGAIIIAVYLQTQSLGAGLMATAILQSAWLKAFQSWMDALSGALLLLAVVSDPWFAVLFVVMACFMNVKVVVPGFLYLFLAGMWYQIVAMSIFCAVAAGIWYLISPSSLKLTWFGSVEVPRRMKAWRKGTATPDFVLWHEPWAVSLIFLVPAVGICLGSSLDYRLWLPAVGYVLFNAYGGVWRPNHWMPLAVIAATCPPPELAALVLLAEIISVRGYLGNVWGITYPGIASSLLEAQVIGENVADLSGDLWVNSFHTQIYVYAKKKPYTGQVEQLEIRDVTPELNRLRDRTLKKFPPDNIVVGPGSVGGYPSGYEQVGAFGKFIVLG